MTELDVRNTESPGLIGLDVEESIDSRRFAAVGVFDFNSEDRKINFHLLQRTRGNWVPHDNYSFELNDSVGMFLCHDSSNNIAILQVRVMFTVKSDNSCERNPFKDGSDQRIFVLNTSTNGALNSDWQIPGATQAWFLHLEGAEGYVPPPRGGYRVEPYFKQSGTYCKLMEVTACVNGGPSQKFKGDPEWVVGDGEPWQGDCPTEIPD